MVLNLMRFIVEQAGDRRGMPTKGQTSQTPPTPFNLIGTVKHAIFIEATGYIIIGNRPVDEVFLRITRPHIPPDEINRQVEARRLQGNLTAKDRGKEQPHIRNGTIQLI